MSVIDRKLSMTNINIAENNQEVSSQVVQINQELEVKGENGDSNTVPFHPSTLEGYSFQNAPKPLWQVQGTGIRHLKRDDTSVFCDYLRFYSGNCQLSYTGLEVIKELVLKGSLYLDKEGCKGVHHFAIRQHEFSGQIHKGSKKTWSYKFENTYGVELYVSDNGSFIDAIKLEFSGQPLSNLLPRNNFLLLCETIKIMYAIVPTIRVSRFDATIEVSHEMLSLYDLEKCHEKGYFHGFRPQRKPIHNYSEFKIGTGERAIRHNVLSGLTLYFGSAKGRAKKVRIYETYEKHGYHGIRIELQLGDHHARNFVNNILGIYQDDMDELEKDSYVDSCVKATKSSCNERIRKYFVGHILSLNTLCFIEKHKKKHNRSIWEQYGIVFPFWRKFIDDMGCALYKVRFERHDTPLQRTIAWAFRVLPSLTRAVEDMWCVEAVMLLVRDIIALSRAKDSEQYRDDPDFQGITGTSASYHTKMDQIRDLGDNAWLELLPANIVRCLRKMNKLHGYPKLFRTVDDSGCDVTFPIFKNKNSEYYQSILQTISV